MQDQVEKVPGSKALASFCEKDDSSKEFTKELRSILKMTAATGRYWHDWAQLRILLCFRLTQVLQEFHTLQHREDGTPMIGPPPPGSETFPDMMERLVQSLDSFTEGAPFTSQRLCEILLSPKDIYNNLDKLALALEKLLLVQSTYPPSTDPYPVQPLSGALPTGSPGKIQISVKLEGHVVNGVPDNIDSFKEMPAIDEEMVDVERTLDAQVAVDMIADGTSGLAHEPSLGEIPQPPGTSSEMLHDSTGVDLHQIPGTNSEMVHDSSGLKTISPLGTTSEMLLETSVSCAIEAAATNAEMPHACAGADLPPVSDTNLEMLPQAADTNLEMLHDSISFELTNAPGSNDMVHESTVVVLPLAAVAEAVASNTEMLHDVTVAELPPPPVAEAVASNTDMFHDATVVELRPAPVREAVASNTEMLHDATIVDMISAPEESIDSIDVKPLRLEEGSSNQVDSSGVHSPQASQGSVDMRQSCPEESVNSHVPSTEGEDRSEDVSMGVVS